MIKNVPAMQETQVDPWVGKIPWRREWLPTPAFLPGEFYGSMSLVGYCSWGHKELQIPLSHTHTHTYTHTHVSYFIT